MAVAQLTQTQERETGAVPGDLPGEDLEARPPQAPRFRLVLLVTLVTVAVAGAGALWWLASTRAVGAAGIQGDQQQVQADREAVMSQAEQLMLRMGTYGPDLVDDRGQMPEYRSQVKQVITPKFAVSFDKQAAVAEQLVSQGRIARKADVFATGVSALDGDSATVLVAGSFTDTYPKTGPREPSPFRLEVTLVKIEGRWLVDDFTPVEGAAR